MDDQIARRRSLDLMSIAEVAYVTTIDADGFPHTRAMFNLRNREQFPGAMEIFHGHDADFVSYFTTNTSSIKVAEILRNPKVAVYFSRCGEFRGLMLRGEMQIVEESTIKEAVWQKGWEIYYPHGPLDADHSLLCFFPDSAIYYESLAPFFFKLKD